jgi:RHS repeat-associated protein
LTQGPGAIANPTADQVVYYHTDAIGSVRLTTDAAGQILSRHDYLSFGQEWSGSATTQDSRLFAAKERDAETTLDYFGARYYQAQTGRFTTVDPSLRVSKSLADPQRWNRYHYARNNPLRFVDPDGADFWDKLSGALNAIASNAGFAPRVDINDDWRQGQRVGDLVSIVAGGAEAVVGAGMIGGGVISSPTGAGVAIATSGAAVFAHGAAMSTSAAIQFSQNTNDGGSAPQSSHEATPATNRGRFEPVRGTSAKRDSETGEIWVKDRLHGNHYEVYKNKKAFDNGERDRAVWSDGRLKEKF